MAFGFPPKYRQDFAHTHSTDEFFSIAAEVAGALGWEHFPISETQGLMMTGGSFSSWGEEVVVELEGAVAHIESRCTGNQVMDWGKNRRNVERFLAKFQELEGAIPAETLARRAAERRASLDNQELGVNQVARSMRVGLLSLLKPEKGYLVTPLLMHLNVLIFIIMVASGVHFMRPDAESLLAWGANFRPSTMDGQAWRLLSSCFLHFGLLHLLLNMYALVYIGRHLEPIIGSGRFLGGYLLAGVAASLASLLFNEFTVSAGASGAIFGMYGVMLAIMLAKCAPKHMRRDYIASIGIFVVYNLVNGFRPGSGVDNAAHIGGLLSGAAIGVALVPGMRQREREGLTYGAFGGLTAALILAMVGIDRALPRDSMKLSAGIDRFAALEEKALRVFNMPEDTPDSTLLVMLGDSGLYYWEQGRQLVDSMQALDLPPHQRNTVALLERYCELRIQSFRLLRRAVEEGTDAYNAELREMDAEVGAIIARLNEE